MQHVSLTTSLTDLAFDFFWFSRFEAVY